MKKQDRMKGIQKSKLNRADYVRRVLREQGVRTPEEIRTVMAGLMVDKQK